MTDRLFHLALADAWAGAFTTGEYRESTLGRTLEEQGFIHMSYAHQVQGVADAFYRGRDDVMLLAIDPARVGVEIREDVDPASGESYPHLYGPLPVTAVVAAHPVELLPDGRLHLEPFFAS